MKTTPPTSGPARLFHKRSMAAACGAALSAALLVGFGSGTATASAGAQGTATCSADVYEAAHYPDGRYRVTVAVKNTGPVTINAWNVKGTLPQGETIESFWPFVPTVDGDKVTFDSAPYGYRPILVDRVDVFVYILSGYDGTETPTFTCQAQA
ncbi:cellulose binding domain-containing protein [Streptomyces sp. H23]|uniref:cellulose binding domain-containing protein n=1 Tax=Streptomyces sp. H23 TaxID=2541723 RepID=UPI00106EE725|nr:cellulose binding domain-containing protein [Streptomyces sp. H23]